MILLAEPCRTIASQRTGDGFARPTSMGSHCATCLRLLPAATTPAAPA
eukprot:CAMPEP_0172754736 /NCGR_PEP_ID=MMETSP1074-20121228/158530_1 /TAXON_ID=2916 /ORGANISM="Ceratium fusus, Strain PA161109" /LENGTH=47 /DNA_ID= /DNA_START= /DNA_END= /DNA_ORIENTATION=